MRGEIVIVIVIVKDRQGERKREREREVTTDYTPPLPPTATLLHPPLRPLIPHPGNCAIR